MFATEEITYTCSISDFSTKSLVSTCTNSSRCGFCNRTLLNKRRNREVMADMSNTEILNNQHNFIEFDSIIQGYYTYTLVRGKLTIKI